MSRSTRWKKRRWGKCFCGRWHVPYLGLGKTRRWRTEGDCPVLHSPKQHNEKFLRFREQRSLPLTEED